ncbi:MAG: hypothetical protein ACOYL5_12105 [Phototrophicaceae bacterium]|jgi:hypothetical protein
MNRRMVVFIVCLFVLVVGGSLTSYVAANGSSGLIPGVLTVTRNPQASVSAFGEGQGFQLFLLIGFILFNLVGASVTGAALFWFLNREVENAKVTPPAQHETILEALRPQNRATDSVAGELPAQN